jgi:hypothetical protein
VICASGSHDGAYDVNRGAGTLDGHFAHWDAEAVRNRLMRRRQLAISKRSGNHNRAGSSIGSLASLATDPGRAAWSEVAHVFNN